MVVTKDKVNMVRAILALLYYIYMSGENMFKGGGCVLYIFLLGFSLFIQWINETKLLSLNGKIVVLVIFMVILLVFLLLVIYWEIRRWWNNRKK
jgi:Ca2+/Na+ antiporter